MNKIALLTVAGCIDGFCRACAADRPGTRPDGGGAERGDAADCAASSPPARRKSRGHPPRRSAVGVHVNGAIPAGLRGPEHGGPGDRANNVGHRGERRMGERLCQDPSRRRQARLHPRIERSPVSAAASGRDVPDRGCASGRLACLQQPVMRRTGCLALVALVSSGAAAQNLVNGHGVPPQIVPLYQERGAPSFTVAPGGSGAGVGGLGGGPVLSGPRQRRTPVSALLRDPQWPRCRRLVMATRHRPRRHRPASTSSRLLASVRSKVISGTSRRRMAARQRTGSGKSRTEPGTRPWRETASANAATQAIRRTKRWWHPISSATLPRRYRIRRGNQRRRWTPTVAICSAPTMAPGSRPSRRHPA